MAVVPYSRPQPGSPVGQPMPSEENLLIAAAIMHQQGKFAPQGQQMAGDVIDMSGEFRAKGVEDWAQKQMNPGKYKTQETLSRALGGGAKVLPMTPKGKE